MVFVYVPTTMMKAGVMTKNLPRPKFEKDIYAIGLVEYRQGKVLKKCRESKNRLRIIVKHSTLFYDDHQQRKDRDQADDDLYSIHERL